MKTLKRLSTWILIIFILILGISFTLLNSEFVAVNLGFKVFTIPLILLMLLPFALGLLLGLAIGFSRAILIMRKREREQVALKLNL